jgi:hypothetical protein
MTKSFNFSDLVDWRLLQAERNVARAERRVMQAEQVVAAAALVAKDQLRQERERNSLLQDQLTKLYASTSWRISHPVRVASLLLQSLRQQSPPLPPPAEIAPPVTTAPLAPREQAILQRLQGRRRD